MGQKVGDYSMKWETQEKGPSFQNIPTACPRKETPSTTEAIESRGLETMEQIRVEKLMQPKHNNVLMFNSVAASVYTTSTQTWAHWFYSLARIRKIEGTYTSLIPWNSLRLVL